MNRRAVITGLLLLVGIARAEPPTWDVLLRDSRAYLEITQASLQNEFALADHERWDIDQDTGQLVFSDGGIPTVVATIQFAGSYSTTSRTWLWGWANPSVRTALVEKLAAVRDYGERYDLAPLVEAKWDATEADGWDMVAVASYLLKTKGVYRPPAGSAIAFVVITDIRKIEP